MPNCSRGLSQIAYFGVGSRPLSPQERNRTQYLRDLGFLSEIARETLSSLQVTQLLWRVVNLLRSRFGYQFAAIGLLEGEHVIVRAGGGLGLAHDFTSSPSEAVTAPQMENLRDEPWIVPLGEGVVGTVAAKGEPRLINDADEAEDYVRVPELAEVKSELAVPLLHREVVIGIIDVEATEKDAFSEVDLHLLETIAALVAPAVHAARLFERERRRVRHL